MRKLILSATMLLMTFALQAQTFVSTTPGSRNVLV